jgi:hypothetical protein
VRGWPGNVKPKATDISRIEAGDLFREAPDTSYLVFMPHVADGATYNNNYYFLKFNHHLS